LSILLEWHAQFISPQQRVIGIRKQNLENQCHNVKSIKLKGAVDKTINEKPHKNQAQQSAIASQTLQRLHLFAAVLWE